MSWLLALLKSLFPPKTTPAPEPAPIPAPAPVIPPPPAPDPGAARVRLYEYAVKALGTDASPNDLAPDEYGCAETVSNIAHRAFLDFPDEILSTTTLYQKLLKHPKFDGVNAEERLPGDIIISPTGYGKTGKIPNGHVGIISKNGIFSNSSASGRFMENYTLSTWNARYQKQGGYPVLFFRRVEL